MSVKKQARPEEPQRKKATPQSVETPTTGEEAGSLTIKPALILPDLWSVVLPITRVVVLLLGKKLDDNGDITEEGKARCAFLAYLIKIGRIPWNAHIVCSGGNGEAAAFKTELLKHLPDHRYWDKHIHLEENARFTRQNVALTLERLKELELEFDVLIVVSSCYHIQRVHTTDFLVPEFGDYLPVRQQFPWKIVISEEAPYPFANWHEEFMRWCANVFQLSHWFGPLETTFHGMNPEPPSNRVVKIIRRPVVQVFKTALHHLRDFANRQPSVPSTLHQATRNFIVQSLGQISNCLNDLDGVAAQLEKALNGRKEVPATYEQWEGESATVNQARAVFRNLDPDYLV